MSAYSAPLGKLARLRSAGVTDLRWGNVIDEHWQGHSRFRVERDTRTGVALPDGVACYAMAGTTAPSPRKRLPGDGLVPVDSALGHHPKRELRLAFGEEHTFIAYATTHLDLLSNTDVYERLRDWLEVSSHDTSSVLR